VALDVLRDLVSTTNIYINSRGKLLNIKLVERIARWIGRMLRMFGLGEGRSTDIGWGQEGGEETLFNVRYALHYVIQIHLPFTHRGTKP
jgi:cysteinyl-tRNA synthetase